MVKLLHSMFDVRCSPALSDMKLVYLLKWLTSCSPSIVQSIYSVMRWMFEWNNVLKQSDDCGWHENDNVSLHI